MSVFLERVFQHGPNIIIHCRRAEEILIRVKKPPYEHAVASAAERLRPNPDYAHCLAGRIGGSFDSQIQRKKRALLCSTYILGSLT